MIAERLFRVVRIGTAAAVVALLAVSSCARKEQPGPGAEQVAESRQAAAPAYVQDVARVRSQYRDVQVPARMQSGSEVVVRFVARNIGVETWPAKGDRPVRFGLHWSNPSRSGSWQAIVWDDGSRADLPGDVPPGGTADLTLRVKAPAQRGSGYKLIVAPLIEGAGWTTDTPYVADVEVF
ncbi:MAG TPA: hypothetical protein VIY96_05640 [Thermoanaerobaculia bacterium]